ncbi:class I SAM-dependent methyltransferase [Vibrio cholerae]|uniref:class I SAM-dependent methyltransferase n=1 Tax=Vibrio cholerae TaxID=666 RepID=UPI00068B572B|nr:class I SAM-dependent methyltransferase [Vibrio cholerae]NOE62305.1 methyltransferase domain-containing protein [Vibrio cholerae]BCN21029.1 putative ubiquinone biosynthesis protein [Vibrio cholerae]GHX09813.1 putative S-adenosylmethionine-dependent methyltransferase/MSMEI_2290 [Vibrio cholerae]
MDNDFYRVFEDRFRGSRDEIKKRLECYKPYIKFVKNYNDNTPIAIDIGCGRGEWLEILSSFNIKGTGIDLDSGMLKACIEMNLDVLEGDGISYLKNIESDSISVVSAFHVIEHISFEKLTELVNEAFRVLKQGGLLILETPNPESIIVGINNFYLDPTHEKPIPHQFLKFFTKYCGFSQSVAIGVNGNTEDAISSYYLFSGVSPDYAIISMKGSDEQREKEFLKIPRTDSLTLHEHCMRFDKHYKAIYSDMDGKIELLSKIINNSILFKIERKILSVILGFKSRIFK